MFVISCQSIVGLTFCEDRMILKFYFLLGRKLKSTLFGVTCSFGDRDGGLCLKLIINFPVRSQVQWVNKSDFPYHNSCGKLAPKLIKADFILIIR